jgi:putative peptidoglycan lipid II flippase
MKLVLLIAVPAAIGLIMLAEPLVATIFYGGVFTTDDVRMTALALQAFAVGLVGFSFVKILAPAYFAREDTRTPVRVGLIALAVNFVLSVSLAWYLTSIGYAGTHAGLALAISVAALLNAFLLYRGLRRKAVLHLSKGWAILLLQILVANAVMVLVLAYVSRSLNWWLNVGVVDRSGWLAVSIAAGAATYFIVLAALGLRPSKLGIRPH